MAGILDSLFQRQQPTGLLGGGGGFGGFLRNNPAMLIQLGSAIGSTAGFPNALKAIGETVPQAMAYDRQGAEKQKQQRAMTALLKSRVGGQEALSPETAQLYMDAGLGDEYLAQYMFPKPKDPIKAGKGDTILDPDTLQPLWEPPAEPGFRPASPEEKAQWGVPADAPLVIGPDNKPSILSPSGVNVRVNTGSDGIDYGDPPNNMSWARDAEGKVLLEQDATTGYMRPRAVPIAGGPIEQDAAASEAKEAERSAQRDRYFDVVTEDIDRIVNTIQTSGQPITGFGSLLSAVPGTDAHNVSKMLDTVKASVGFNRLQEMRAASPTGGALGQVSNLENMLLQATLGSLEQSQTKEQLVYNLKRVQKIYRAIISTGISADDPLVDEALAPTPQQTDANFTEEDIQFTMQKHGLTREQVLERLRNAP